MHCLALNFVVLCCVAFRAVITLYRSLRELADEESYCFSRVRDGARQGKSVAN